MNDSRAPTVLIICDGWGVGATDPEQIERQGNAVAMARTPVRDRLLADREWNLLTTSGEAVGLPPGQMGNSEVGHLNLGAGRIVYQDITRISIAIREGTFYDLPELQVIAGALKGSGGRLHLMGLCSDGGVHSHIEHLWALLEWAERKGLPTRIHCFTDGRDTSPTSGRGWVAEAVQRTDRMGDARVQTVSGRYFAMDRDRRWERTEQAYRCIAEGEGPMSPDAVAYLDRCYAEGVTDEFLPPVVIGDPGNRPEGIGPNDAVLFFNFRADRARQLTTALTEEVFDGFDRHARPVTQMVTMTRYQEDLPLPVLFHPVALENVLGRVLAEAGMRQLRMAETEKYPHVTYFFNGGLEEPFEGEDRHLIPSPKVATYDLKPEMSARELTDALLDHLAEGQHDFVLVNYANADMVGHTGSIPAAIAAVETVDDCVGQVLEAVKAQGGTAFVTADHGNAEKMLDDEGKPFTAHTVFPVRFIYVPPAPSAHGIRAGTLADVAPTLLEVMGIPQPSEMTGTSLLTG
ncbi:MAG: 2,3-bisphosphoglycerate-independent phosphoglycerate mutase [Gemmatimonadetes bacterium]|nr:2,3-bisphosphoglycerate-independent phosphoglycerate mutase [Gemmatimonadota bacterium]